MNTHNICFYGEIGKIIPKLSQNTLLICSTASYPILGICCNILTHSGYKMSKTEREILSINE